LIEQSASEASADQETERGGQAEGEATRKAEPMITEKELGIGEDYFGGLILERAPTTWPL
jgi:hypothetical protein